MKYFFVFLMSICLLAQVNARVIVVNQRPAVAADSNAGTAKEPLKTIQAGISMAFSGDTVLVKSGIYREKVIPLRSGEPGRPITIMAAPGEMVSIRGSEHIADWNRTDEGLWLAVIDNMTFGDFNPYTENVSGAWIGNNETSHSNCKYHLGDVYHNGEAFYEVFSKNDCKNSINSWYTEQDSGKTLIYANFGSSNPNESLAEINFREAAVFPETSGLSYLVIDGFDIRHTASQWSDIYRLEEGAIGTRYGYRWIIQNCTITNSRNNGISMGVTDELHFPHELAEGGGNMPEYGKVGFHIIRNNKISRCGQCGIYGCYGAVGTLIENNEITETAYRNEWSGPNQADIKILFPIDVTISGNKFLGSSCYAIWLDWGSQNARVTKNVIMNRPVGVFTEVSFGPTIFDNNVFINAGICDWSNGGIYVHNLFYHCPGIAMSPELNRPFVPYYAPHSTKVIGRTATESRNIRWFNNIFIGDHSTRIAHQMGSDFKADNNVYIDGAPRFAKEGKGSIDCEESSSFAIKNEDGRMSISFNLDSEIFEMKCKVIKSKEMGKVPLSNIFPEHTDGTPLDILSDYKGNRIDSRSVRPGPFQCISPGFNEFVIW